MDYEKSKNIKLQSILKLFMSIIKKASASDSFDYTDDPVDSHTDWDYIPDDSVRTVYSISGPHHPDIQSHSYNQHFGIVITFDAELGGNNQIFLSRSVLALRQIGNPAGWSYLGLNGNQKIYIDQDTAEVLNNIIGHAHRAGLINDDSDQKIGGNKEFLNLPTYQGDPLVTNTQLNAVKRANHKADQDIIDTQSALDDNEGSTAANTEAIEDLASASSDYATKSELSNYTPLNQLRFYATKKQIDDVMDNYGILGIKETIHRMNTRFANIENSLNNKNNQNTTNEANDDKTQSSDLASLKASMQTLNTSFHNLFDTVNSNKQASDKKISDLSFNLSKQIALVNQKVDSLDLGKVKDTIHKIDLRAQQEKQQTSSVSALSSSLASNAVNVSKGMSTNARRLNSADARFYQLNQHNKKADKVNHDAVGSLSNVDTSYKSILTNHADNINSLFSSTASLSTGITLLNGKLPANVQDNIKNLNLDTNIINGLKNGVSANAKRLNNSATDIFNIKQHIKKANKRFTDAITSLSNKHAGAANPANNTSLTSLSIAVSGFEQNVMTDINSLSVKAKTAQPANDNAQITAVAQASNATKTSQNGTNASLSTAIYNNAQSASSIESRLVSALSKHQLG